MKILDKKNGPIDKLFLILLAAEIVLGMIFLFSASASRSYAEYRNSWHYFFHQFYAGFLPGVAGMYLIVKIGYRRLLRWAPVLAVTALILMILVFVPGIGREVNGARSWLNFGFSFQPVEFLKLAAVIFFAALFAKNEQRLAGAFWPLGVFFVTAFLLLVKQPDLGSLVIFSGIVFIMIFAAGLPYRYLFFVLAAGGGALYYFARSAAYRIDRLMVFLHPELDPQGVGYQVRQGYLAIGSGGLFGLGLGHSLQKEAFLPEAIGDSIFSVIAEEMGFIFTVLFVVLIGIIIWRGLIIAGRAEGLAGKTIATGVISWFGVQSFLNIGAMLGLVPLTGVPLPLVSYGGSAMVVILWGFGLVLSVSKDRAR
jgi:cell division protein FtsW